MRYKRTGVFVLIVIVIALGNYMIQSFMSYADEASVEYISQLPGDHELTESRMFADEKELAAYYDQLFTEIRFQSDREVDILVDSIRVSYSMMDEDERDSPMNQAKLVSEFVVKAKNYEDFIKNIIDHYLKEMEGDLIIQGFSQNSSEKIASRYRKDIVDIWQRNLIVDALDHMTEEEQ